MTTALRFQGAARRLIRHFGSALAVTLRRPHRLADPLTGNAPALQMNGAAGSGATTINIDAMAVQGLLPKGLTLTIAGVTGTYTVQADVTAAVNQLNNVTISPGLTGAAADNAAVTVAAFASFSFEAVRGAFRRSDEAQREVRTERWLLAAGATEVTDDDFLVLPDGQVIQIGSVWAHRYDSSTPVGYVVEGRQ